VLVRRWWRARSRALRAARLAVADVVLVPLVDDVSVVVVSVEPGYEPG
jgi:hypothetical protein